METWSTKTLIRDYWRVPVLALIVGLLAFAGSFVFPPTYASDTKLLIRGREATFLTTTGQDLSSQPGVIDATLAKALGETQSALLSSRVVAETVVDRLALDQVEEEEPSGVIGTAKGWLGDGIKRTRAYLTAGFYEEPDKREQAISDVNSGLSAAPIQESYVLVLTATSDDPDTAADIANTAADVLVELSTARFSADAAAYRDRVKVQVDKAAQDEAAATQAVIDRRYALGISDAVDRAQLTEPGELAALERLERDQELAGNRFQQLSVEYQLAAANVDSGLVEVTRIDTASVPTYPVKPVRFLYLGVGLVVGALIGLLLSWRRLSKKSKPVSVLPALREEIIDLRDPADSKPEYAMPQWQAAATNGVSASPNDARESSD